MFKDKALIITVGTGSFGNVVLKRFLAVPEHVLQLRSPQEFWRELLGAVPE